MEHYLHMIPRHSRSIQVTTLCTAQQTAYVRTWVALKNPEIMSMPWGNGGLPVEEEKEQQRVHAEGWAHPIHCAGHKKQDLQMKLKTAF